MDNGGMIGRRNVPGVDGYSGVWSLREMADARRSGLTFPAGIDSFASDSTAQYTQSADVNATWSVSGGDLIATGGTHALFIRNGASYTDAAVEADIYHAHDSGLVLRFINNSNYYMLILSDDSGAAPTGNIRIFRRSAGTITQIGPSSDIVWPRSEPRQIRFQAVGTVLSAYVGGVKVISATDSTHAGPGGVGMRNSTSGQQSKFQEFRWGPLP
jgi:hypothetical protein